MGTRMHITARRLADVPVGEAVVVRAMHGERFVARRLMEMGLTPGTVVNVVRRAPMGDPVELRLRRYSLSIRLEDAASVEVEPKR